MLPLGIAMHTFWYTAMTINRFTKSAPTSNAAGNVRVLLPCGMELTHKRTFLSPQVRVGMKCVQPSSLGLNENMHLAAVKFLL